MNGGVNGMMETSELSHADTPENCKDELNMEDDPLLNKLNCNDPETENHLDSTTESLEDANNIAEVTISNGVVHKFDCVTNENSQDPEQENINNDPIENHCTIISNELSVDSVNGTDVLDDKPELVEELDPLENCNNEMPKTERIVSDNGVSDSESSQDHSQDEECSEVLGQQKAEGTVSINSESELEGDDSSQEGKKVDQTIAFLLKDWSDGQIQTSNDSSSPEVQEIVSDNENNVPKQKQAKSKPVTETTPPLRRSSRAIKRKRYDDQDTGNDSEPEEVVMPDSKRRSKAIVINNTKSLVEMAARQMKFGNPKKDNTVVIIDSKSDTMHKGYPVRKNMIPSVNTAFNAQNLYQSILARGTTVTPVSAKNIPQTQSSSNSQPSILPSLTDDMFVVEAPSFIVPYVYEKPSVKPFREFVDQLGEELAAQKAKEEEQQKENEKAEKEKDTKKTADVEIKDKDVDAASLDTEDENAVNSQTEENAEEAKPKKESRKERRRRKRDDDDASWDGESSSDSDDDVVTDEEDAIVIKAKADSIEEIKDITDMTVEKIASGKSDNYFDMSLGKFFMDIGLNFVQEYVQNDLVKQQNRKLYREKKGGHSTKATEASIVSLMKNLQISKENNAPYRFKQHKCEFCTFKSESMLVISHHLETPHMKNNVYKCNFCEYDSKSPHDILYHMESKHNTRGRLERAPSYHQCANCPFEDNGKGKLARHLVACGKKFKAEFNLSPPIEWEPPAKIPKMARARNQMMGSYQNTFHRGNVNNNFGRPIMNNFGSSSMFRPRGRSPMGASPRLTPVQGIPILRGGIIARHNNPAQMSSNSAGNEKNMTGPKSGYQPSISITPLPRQPQPVQLSQLPPQSQQNKSTCVICEICDGYIKDLEQLRNHMQWIHKVKIHPKMIYNRPPLNCQKCQFRFFTDQGLERHLLGTHGLVTSSMQEAANKGKDAGRCPVCGRVYQWKLLNHVTRDHKLTLKPAHLSYKCTVCTATFGMYKQFENHVYSAHSVVAKRVMDKGKTAATSKTGQSLLKPLKINDEITIIPQPVKSATPPIKDK